MTLDNRKNLLLFLLIAETFLGSYGLILGEQTLIVSILYLLAGAAFIFSMLILPRARIPKFYDLKRESIPKWPVLIGIFILAFITSRYWIEKIPLDPDYADMLPIIKVMNERFLQFDWKQVYDPIPEIWNGTRPIYLPAMWLPYFPFVAFQTDVRWVTVIAVCLSFSVILFLTRIRRNKYYGIVQVVIAAALFWWIFSRNDVHSVVSMSEEGVVIFYFVLLTMAIVSGNPVFMGVMTSLCLLSRYSMIGWVLPCMIYFMARKNLFRLTLFSITCMYCFLLLFLIPFGFTAVTKMFALPDRYVSFGRHIWESSPEVYWQNLGLAKFYGPHRMALLHGTLLTTTFAVPLLFMLFCLYQKKWRLRNINLACFKLSLLVFYQFIDVPYGYLFYTCSFVSLASAAMLLKSPAKPRSWVIL